MKPFIAHRLTNGAQEKLTHERISPPAMDHALATECLLKVKEIFDARALRFWLIYGTLLGAIRDGDFIPWDCDIDLGVYEDDAEEIYPAILELQKAGMEVIRTGSFDNSFQVKKGMICIYFASMAKMGSVLWRWDRFYEPGNYFSELIEQPFLDTTFLIPKRYEEFLRMHYSGDAWKTPDPKAGSAKLFRLSGKQL